MIFKSNDMSKKIKAYFGRGVNKIEIELTEEQVERLQKHIRLKREEEKLAKKEGREPRTIPY